MRKAILACAVIALLNRASAVAEVIDIRFAIDPASPSINGTITPDDVLGPGPVVVIPGTALGLQDSFFAGVFDNLDALSNGRDPIVTPIFFSVDRVSVGLPGSAVNALAVPGVADAARHVYVTQPPFGSNSLVIDGTRLGLRPGFFGDDLNGLDFDLAPTDTVFFSIDSLSASIDATHRPGDIFIGSLASRIPHTLLGLGPDDDLDALVLDLSSSTALFSLSPFSPLTFTFTGLDYQPGVPGHLSPGDILFSPLDGTFGLYLSARQIGLEPGDNVDALETIIPEPSSLVLAAIGMAGVGVAAWRRRRCV